MNFFHTALAINSRGNNDSKDGDAGKKRRLPVLSAFKDRMEKSTPGKVTSLIRSVMSGNPDEANASLKEAARMFGELDDAGRKKVLKKVEAWLDPAAKDCWSSEINMLRVHNIAVFFRHATDSKYTSKPIESADECGKCPDYLIEAGIAQEAERSTDGFRRMQLWSAIAVWRVGERDQEVWEELLKNTRIQKELVYVMLNRFDAENSGELGWTLLKENLGRVRSAVVESESKKKECFIKWLMKGDDLDDAITGFEMAQSLENYAEIDGMPEQMAAFARRLMQSDNTFRAYEGFRLAFQLENRSDLVATAEKLSTDAKDETIQDAALVYIDACAMIAEMDSGGVTRIIGTNGLIGLIMSGGDEDHIKPVLEARFEDMVAAMEESSPSEQLCTLMSMGIMSSIGIGQRGGDQEVQQFINGLLDKFDDESRQTLIDHSARITIPIAKSPSKNRDSLIRFLLTDRDAQIVSNGFDVVINLSTSEDSDATIIRETKETAETVLTNKCDDLKPAASEFLGIMELKEKLDLVDAQYEAAHKLIDIYLQKPNMIGIMIDICVDMQEIVIDAQEEARAAAAEAKKSLNEVTVDVQKPMEVILRLMDIGIMPANLEIIRVPLDENGAPVSDSN
jgi:hypothetical protein